MDESFTYPSWIRRVLMIVVYLVALFLIWVFAQYFLLSGRCFLYNDCSSIDSTVRMSITLFCVAGLLLIIYLGIMSRLLGARRKPRKE